MLPFVRTVAITALALATVLAGRAGAQDCETGGARVTFDVQGMPLTDATIDGPVELTIAGGAATLKQPPGPGAVTVTSTGGVSPNRSASMVRFRFDRTGRARLVVTRPSRTSFSWFAVERDSTTCSFPITTMSALPGVTELAADDINQHPLEVEFSQAGDGETRTEITAPFQKDVVYRLVFYVQRTSFGTTSSQTFVPFDGADYPDGDPALKLLPPGADPLTGCPGTDVSNLNAAYRAESIAISHFQMLNQVYEDATQGEFDASKFGKLKVTQRDADVFRRFVELSFEHLRCARILVEGRTDLDPTAKATALAEIDSAMTKDQQAVVDLDTPVGLSNPDAELLARMSAAAITLQSALTDKQEAGQQVSPGYAPPPLEAALNEGAALADAVALAEAKLDPIESALVEYREKLDRLAQEVRNGGAAGLDRVIGSNLDPRCREFLEKRVIGDLDELVVAFERQEREAELARILQQPTPPKPVVAATSNVIRGAEGVAGAVSSVGAGVGKVVSPGSSLSTTQKANKAIDQLLKMKKKIDKTTTATKGVTAIPGLRKLVDFFNANLP